MKKEVIFGFLLLLLFANLVSSSSMNIGFSVGSVEAQNQQPEEQSSSFNVGIYMIVIFAAVLGFMVLKTKSKKKKKSLKKKKKSKK